MMESQSQDVGDLGKRKATVARHVKKSKVFSRYICGGGTRKLSKPGNPASFAERTRMRTHTQAAKQQPQGRTRVPTRCLLASCGSGLQGTLCHPSTSGPGFAGDLTARTKQQWPVQKWPKRGLEKGRRRNPAVLLITSGCEKTEPQGSPKLSWQRDSSKRRSSLESRRAFVGYRERWWGRIP